MRFIWDPAKATLNYMKHGVSFGDALTTFDDPAGLYIPDRSHPERGNLIGLSAATQLLFVVHVELLTDDTLPATRIISARRATGPEHIRYQAQSTAPSRAKTKYNPKLRRERRASKPLQSKQRRRTHEEE
jgi:uncharacterized DUF497 family protein